MRGLWGVLPDHGGWRRPVSRPFARIAHRTRKLHFLLAGSPSDPVELARVRAGMLEYLALIDTLEGIEASMNVLTILFAPEQPVLSLAEYHRQAWNVMQNWIDHDPQGGRQTSPESRPSPLEPLFPRSAVRQRQLPGPCPVPQPKYWPVASTDHPTAGRFRPRRGSQPSWRRG